MRGGLSPAAVEPSPFTLDLLVGDWKIWQLRRGQRFSTDDLSTAWLAARVAPGARRLLDIGAGIGSVGLMTLWRMAPEAHLTMVEAQAESQALAHRTVASNNLGDRVHLRLGDLRDDAVIPERDHFDLVTGSPPYIPLGKGVVSPVPQRAGARMELRGSIVDYAARAAVAMRPDGWFVCCFSARDDRGEPAIAAAGLHLRARYDVVFREAEPPMITLFAATRTPGPCERPPPLVVRDTDGRWTPTWLALREEMGCPSHKPKN